jgi:transketolase
MVSTREALNGVRADLFDEHGQLADDVESVPTRQGYGDALVELGTHDDRVIVLTGDLADSTKVGAFRDRFPGRFFDLGVAEQNMMGVAAGLALTGKIPFVSSYATFSPGRNWDQFRVSVAYTRANVKVAGAHSGLSVGPDGATHQAMEDVAMVRALPNVIVVVPCDAEETRKATLAVTEVDGPAYLRFARNATPLITTPDAPFAIGQATVVRDGDDVAIVACGPLLVEAMRAAEILARDGIDARVVNNHTIKPLDEATLVAAAEQTGAVVTVEEHQVNGGLGGAVAELLAQHHPVPMDIVGMPDHFGESGAPAELLARWGLTAEDIARRAAVLVRRKT